MPILRNCLTFNAWVISYVENLHGANFMRECCELVAHIKDYSEEEGREIEMSF